MMVGVAMGPGSTAVLLVAGRCGWVPARQDHKAAAVGDWDAVKVFAGSTSSPRRCTNTGRRAGSRSRRRSWTGGGRPCGHAAQVPAVLRVRLPGASDSVHRESVGHSSYATETDAHSAVHGDCEDFTGAVRLAVPVVAQRQVPGMVLTVQITVVVPQLQSFDVAVDISVVAQRQLPVWEFTAVNMQRKVPAVLGELLVQKKQIFHRCSSWPDVH